MSPPVNYLLIDDSAQDQALAQEAFEQLCPECVLTRAPSGSEALEILRTHGLKPDVVLLDLNMPGMNGFEVLQALKEDPRLQTIPVVILSTSKDTHDVSRAYTLHASSYLVKSPSFAAFVEQVDTVLKYWRAAQLAHRPGPAAVNLT